VARLFRLLEKKRGARRTGSNLVGSLGEALFCGGLFLLGALSLSSVVAANLRHPEPEAYSLGFGFWLTILVLSSFVITGASGLMWTVFRIGTSAERRTVMAQQAARLDLLNPAAPQPRDYPNVPSHEGLINSPGTELAYRLPPAQSPGWRLLATTVFALVWNGVGCVLMVWAIKSHLLGRPEWFLTVFLAPYLCVSAWSIHYLLRLIWVHTGMGPTTLEISDHPLLPGHEYQVTLLQHGHITVRSLQLWLLCEEEATYHQGTDIRTELRVVYQQRLFQQTDFEIEPSQPFQQTATFTMPATAMHSFQSAHNAVHWKLLVKGTVAGWPDFERAFALVVYPGQATSQISPLPSALTDSRRPRSEAPTRAEVGA
jgi:hypothetical protein